MKTNIFQITLVMALLLQSLFAKGQLTELDSAKIKGFYTLTWQEDSLNQYHVREEKMVLLVGNHFSLFCTYGSYFMDSVLRLNPNMSFEQFRQLNAPRRFAHHFNIKKDFLADQITTADRVFSDAYIYTEHLSKIRWNLKDEIDQIKGYSVQKAIANCGGREWEAWFAEAIPFRDGPYKFSGLPGLILKIQDSRRQYVFEIESILTTNEQVYFRDLSYYIRTDKSQFLETQKKFNQDAVGNVLSSGIPLHQSQNADFKRIEENLRRRNNPIELKPDSKNINSYIVIFNRCRKK